MFQLFETICVINSKLLNLEWHQKRVDSAFEQFYQTSPPQLSEVIILPSKLSNDLKLKCRFLYNKHEWQTEFEEYKPKKIKSLKIVGGGILNYPHKFTDRDGILRLFEQRGNCDDILIVKDGLITDTSIANIIFFNGMEWHTPNSPLLKGTCRERLLNNKIISEEEITAKSLKNYSHFMLINAMNDFNTGNVCRINKIC